MTDEELQRYARQIVLPSIGSGGQKLLGQAHVTIVGCGGLGTIAAAYLAAAGIGRLRVIDPGRVELSNLHRQWIYAGAPEGSDKVKVFQSHVRDSNPHVDVEAICASYDQNHLANTQLVLDCTDNGRVRAQIARDCWTKNLTLISGSVLGLSGQVTTFKNGPTNPCRECLFPDQDDPTDQCAALGVLGPVVGVIGALQATEAIRNITTFGTSLVGKLLLIDAYDFEIRKISVKKRSHCHFCQI